MNKYVNFKTPPGEPVPAETQHSLVPSPAIPAWGVPSARTWPDLIFFCKCIFNLNMHWVHDIFFWTNIFQLEFLWNPSYCSGLAGIRNWNSGSGLTGTEMSKNIFRFRFGQIRFPFPVLKTPFWSYPKLTTCRSLLVWNKDQTSREDEY